MAVRAASLLVLAVLVAGCSENGTKQAPQSRDAAFEQMVADAREDAVEAGASDAQLEDLDRALAAGGISYEDARAAVERAVACMNDAGLKAELVVSEVVPGLLMPGYNVSPSTGPVEDLDDIEALMSVADPCDQRENLYTSVIYQMQPSTQNARYEYFEKQRPVIVACLNENGVATEEEQTADELARAASDLVFRSLESGSENPVNCLAQAGIDGW